MKRLIVATLLLSTALALPIVTEAPWQAWTGPIADHQLGVHPSDTLEVFVAKSQHLKAFQEVLAGLPLLPLENFPEELPKPQEVGLSKALQLSVLQSPVQPTVLPKEPVAVLVRSTSTVPLLLAEEVPRSAIGEVPEVHAARVAHLNAVQEALEAAALFRNVED